MKLVQSTWEPVSRIGACRSFRAWSRLARPSSEEVRGRFLGVVAILLVTGCGVSCSGKGGKAVRGDAAPPSVLDAAASVDAVSEGDAPIAADGSPGERPAGAVVTAIAAGLGHACAITKAGLWCWGKNGSGELGHDGPDTLTPRLVPLPEPPTAVTAGGCSYYAHTCALMAGGTVYCWGSNKEGQLGDGTTTTRPDPRSVPGLDQVASVGAACSHTCALKKDGTVWCWGQGRDAELGTGRLLDYPSPVQVKGLTDVQALAVGTYHACALRPGGSVLCWGGNNNGEVGSGDQITRLVPTAVDGLTAILVAAGDAVSCAVLPDRTAVCWGTNEYGEIGDGKGGERFAVALAPTRVTGLIDVETLAVGGIVCAISRTRRLACWGANYTGGVPGSDQKRVLGPFAIDRVMQVTALALGATVSFALLADGTVWGWGRGEAAQVEGNKPDTPTLPHPILGISD